MIINPVTELQYITPKNSIYLLYYNKTSTRGIPHNVLIFCKKYTMLSLAFF